jgi:ankyrin repeat protein
MRVARGCHRALTRDAPQEGQTPLAWAAEKGHSGVVRLLLERRAASSTISHVRRTRAFACVPAGPGAARCGDVTSVAFDAGAAADA